MILVKKGMVFFVQNPRKRGVFQICVRAWYTLWSGVGVGSGGGGWVMADGISSHSGSREMESVACQNGRLAAGPHSRQATLGSRVTNAERGLETSLSKWLPDISPLVHTILPGVGLSIMIRWPHLLCKPSMIPPCHLGIQQLHTHWKYPSGSGIYSHTVSHFPVASRWPTASILFTAVSLRSQSVNHIWLCTSNSFEKKRLLADMSTFTPTKRIFRDSQILSHWYHFEAQLVGNNIWKKIGILATAFLAILICIYKNKRLHGGPSVAGDCSYPPPKMVTAETLTSVTAAFDHVAGHGLFRFLTC